MDKQIILAFYIDIGNLDSYEISTLLKGVEDYHSHLNTLNIFIPIRGENRVECLNPQLINEEEYKEALNFLNTVKKELHEFFQKNNER